MRSLLVKSSITLFILLALGSSLTLAATSSEPGMFLYPIKQTTQKFTGAAGDPVTSLTPVIEVPPESEDPPPAANVDTPSEEDQADVAQEPDRMEPGQASEATATPVRIVDEITVTVELEQVPSAGADTVDTIHSSPAVDPLGSDYENNGPDDGQPESSNADDMDDGLVDKEESNDSDSNSNNDSGRSESSHDHESNDDDDD
jgi:hypothetical protein